MVIVTNKRPARSSLGNIQASLTLHSFLTKIDRFAKIITLRQAQGKNKSKIPVQNSVSVTKKVSNNLTSLKTTKH